MAVIPRELLIRLRGDASELVRAGRQGQDAIGGIGAAASSANRVLASVGAAVGVREIIEAADSYKLMAARLQLVADGTSSLAVLQNRLFQASQRSRTELESTSKLYTRIALNADQLGLSQERILSLTETIQKSIQIGGATSSEASSGVVQFSQALASGTLRGDEFRSVMENMPALARTIADGLGVPIGKLREMSQAGELTATNVIAAIEKMRDTVERDWGSMPDTIGGAMTQLTNDLKEAIGQMDSATGASSRLASGITTLGTVVRTSFSGLAEQLRNHQERMQGFRQGFGLPVEDSSVGRSWGGPSSPVGPSLGQAIARPDFGAPGMFTMLTESIERTKASIATLTLEQFFKRGTDEADELTKKLNEQRTLLGQLEIQAAAYTRELIGANAPGARGLPPGHLSSHISAAGKLPSYVDPRLVRAGLAPNPITAAGLPLRPQLTSQDVAEWNRLMEEGFEAGRSSIEKGFRSGTDALRDAFDRAFSAKGIGAGIGNWIGQGVAGLASSALSSILRGGVNLLRGNEETPEEKARREVIKSNTTALQQLSDRVARLGTGLLSERGEDIMAIQRTIPKFFRPGVPLKDAEGNVIATADLFDMEGFKAELAKLGLGIEDVERIAEEYRVTLDETAASYVALAEATKRAALAMIFSTYGGRTSLLGAEANIFDWGGSDPRHLERRRDMFVDLTDIDDEYLKSLDLTTKEGRQAFDNWIRQQFTRFKEDPDSFMDVLGKLTPDQFLDLMSSTEGVIDSFDELNRQLQSAMRNVPAGFKVALQTFKATNVLPGQLDSHPRRPLPPGDITARSTPVDGSWNVQTLNINVKDTDSGRKVMEKLERAATEHAKRGGASAIVPHLQRHGGKGM